MRQAIEEGFILDVLQNYTTYSTYWKLNKDEDDDRGRVQKGQGDFAMCLSIQRRFATKLSS